MFLLTALWYVTPLILIVSIILVDELHDMPFVQIRFPTPIPPVTTNAPVVVSEEKLLFVILT